MGDSFYPAPSHNALGADSSALSSSPPVPKDPLEKTFPLVALDSRNRLPSPIHPRYTTCASRKMMDHGKPAADFQRVDYEYKKLNAKTHEKRLVEPWHLACVSGQWYLLGYDQERQARRIFVLAGMRNVCSTDRFAGSAGKSGSHSRRCRKGAAKI